MKIRGNTVGTTMPRPDWEQTDPRKADYIKNKPGAVLYTEQELTEGQKAQARANIGVVTGGEALGTGKFIGEVTIDNDETRTIEFTQCADGSPLNFDELFIMVEGGADASRNLCFTTNNEYNSSAYNWTVQTSVALVADATRYNTVHCKMMGERWIILGYTQHNNVYGANVQRNYTTTVGQGKERCINSLVIGIGWGHFTSGTKIAVYGR